MSWEAPAALGGASLLAYQVDWDTNGGAREVQKVALTSASIATVSGTFQLAYGVHRTRPLPFDASSDQVDVALEGLAPVASVDVTRTALPNGFEWVVTFVSNTGDLPTLTPLPAGLVGSPSLTVVQLVAGADPTFDSGTVGVNVLPLGSAPVGGCFGCLGVRTWAHPLRARCSLFHGTLCTHCGCWTLWDTCPRPFPPAPPSLMPMAHHTTPHALHCLP